MKNDGLKWPDRLHCDKYPIKPTPTQNSQRESPTDCLDSLELEESTSGATKSNGKSDGEENSLSITSTMRNYYEMFTSGPLSSKNTDELLSVPNNTSEYRGEHVRGGTTSIKYLPPTSFLCLSIMIEIFMIIVLL